MGVVGLLLLMAWASSTAAALQSPGVEIGPDHTREAHVGDTILYDHTLTNTGVTTDTFTLEVVSSQGWPVDLVGASQPPGTLSLQVAPQMAAPFQISLVVPQDAVGLTDTTVVTARSQLTPTVEASATDTTTIVPHRYFLPLIMDRWPPLPYATTLNPIDNADGDEYYTVTWLPAQLATVHMLEEDDNASFTSPSIVYYGSATSWTVPSPGKLGGTYYYRVQGQSLWGYGPYSNVRSVSVPRFRVEDTSLTVGQCTTLTWNFTDIKELHVVLGYGYDGTAVPGQASRQVCPSVTTVYEAIVTKLDNTEETHRLVVNVTGTGCADPVVWSFASTAYSVHAGESFVVFWHVECAKAVWLVIDGKETAAVGQAHKEMTISKNTTFKLKIKKRNDEFVYASFTVGLK
jgi:hypothetical protein